MLHYKLILERLSPLLVLSYLANMLTFFFFILCYRRLFNPFLSILLLCSWFSSFLHTALLSGCSRSVSHLLAAFLCDSHSEHPLQDMLCASWALQCFHLAGVCQQRPQPCYLHHLQHRVPTGLHQDPQLLRETACQEIKMKMRLCTHATTLSWCIWYMVTTAVHWSLGEANLLSVLQEFNRTAVK